MWHAKASEAAVNAEKMEIFRIEEQNVPTNVEHDEFTRRVKNKGTILRAVFLGNKSQDTFENLRKATKALEKFRKRYVCQPGR